MKIYISGPITNDPDFLRHFKYHAEKLRDKGHTVLDPTVWSREKLRLTYDEFMKLDIAMLEVCNAIYMLPGWSDSQGAKKELERAVELGLKIYYSDRNNIPNVPKVIKKVGKYD